MQPRKIWGGACEIMVGRKPSKDPQTVLMMVKTYVSEVDFNKMLNAGGW